MSDVCESLEASKCKQNKLGYFVKPFRPPSSSVGKKNAERNLHLANKSRINAKSFIFENTKAGNFTGKHAWLLPLSKELFLTELVLSFFPLKSLSSIIKRRRQQQPHI